MNVVLHLTSLSRSIRSSRRLPLAALAGATALAVGGCASPKAGPTDPKEFITQRRSWVPYNPNTASAPAAAPAIDPGAPATSP